MDDDIIMFYYNVRGKHKTPRQLGLATLYPFRDIAQRRVAEHGVQYLRWVFFPYLGKIPRVRRSIVVYIIRKIKENTNFRNNLFFIRGTIHSLTLFSASGIIIISYSPRLALTGKASAIFHSFAFNKPESV